MPFKTGIGMDENIAGSMGLLQGLQGLGPAGLQRTASPAGSIAQNLMPIFSAMLQAKAMQQQAALESMLKQAQIAHLLGGAGVDPEMQAAKLGKIKAETGLAEARTRAAGQPKAPSSMEVAQGALAGDPGMVQLNNFLEQQKRAHADYLSQQTAARSEELRASKAAQDERIRLDAPAQKSPEFRGKVLLDPNTLKEAHGVPTRVMESPDAPYVALDKKQLALVIGAKQIQQQINRLKVLIPGVLPETRLGIPNTLSQAAFGKEASGKAAEFDRLSEFEQMVGIKDFIAGRGPNQAEIHNIGRVSRWTDSQASAMGKIAAMQQLLDVNLSALGLNPQALNSNFVPTKLSESPTPNTLTPKINVDMKTPAQNQAVQAIIDAHPDWDARKVADYYARGGR